MNLLKSRMTITDFHIQILDKLEDIQEMTKLLQKAEAELEEELQRDMKDGATSKRFSRKKVTVV